jgi:hypothetical protein
MDGDSGPESAKPATARLEAPTCVHLYVWVFMVALNVSPMIYVLSVHHDLDRAHGLESLVIIGLIQIVLWMTQRRCSREDLSYWEGLLVVAGSVTTGENVMSVFRACCLLFAVVIISALFALDHDPRYAARDAQLRFGSLIVWLHKHGLWSRSHS